MKKFLVLVIAITSASFAFAQDAPAQDATPIDMPIVDPNYKPPQIDTAAKTVEIKPPSGKYCCAFCGLRMEEPGICEKHKFTLVEIGKYYCPDHDSSRSNTPVKCPKCDKDMKKMEPFKYE